MSRDDSARPPLPTRLTIRNCAHALDGGTIWLEASDEAGSHREVELIQHASPASSAWPDRIPGRLYFDGQLVPMRSGLETELLALLRSAEVLYEPPVRPKEVAFKLSPKRSVLGEDIREMCARNPVDNQRALKAELIRFVESEQYIRFAEKVEQAADQTRYDVFIAWDVASQKQVLVRLASVLGISLPAAREMLSGGGRIAQGISALEVSDSIQQYAEKGLALRIEPEFRWRPQ